MSAIGPDDREQLHQFKAELLTLFRESTDGFFEERAAIREFDGKLRNWLETTSRERQGVSPMALTLKNT